MKKQFIRVGFDLDGVILYNPIRIARPFIALFKELLLRKKDLSFYYPKSTLEQYLWKILHKSSIFIAPGLDDVKKLVKNKKIKAYIITARYSFMGKELLYWFKKKELDRIFSELYYNKHDEQPHLFKERLIKKLDLDYYVEDNFDIVKHLHTQKATKVLWIFNLFDRGITYTKRFPYLKKAVEYIQKKT